MNPTRFALVSAAAAALVAAVAEPAAAQACPAAPIAGPACALQNNTLVVQSEAGTLELRGAWRPDPGGAARFTSNRGFSVVTPAGALPVPAGEVTVNCDAGFSVTGSAPRMPGFGQLFPGAHIGTQAPSVAFGMGRGDALAEMGVPVDPCRTYAYFAIDTGVVGGVEGASVTPYSGDQGVIVVDPFDPGFFVSAGGERLTEATAGFLASAGFGFSASGLIPWQSALDVPTGIDDTVAPVDLDAHVYVAAMVGVLPLPGSPVQLYVDGTIAADLGPWADTAPAVAAGLLSGEALDVAQLVADRTGVDHDRVLESLRLGANAESIELAIHHFGIELGRASLVMENGRLSFAAEEWTPGRRFKDRNDRGAGAVATTGLEALDRVLANIGIGQRLDARGFIDAERFHIELGADLEIGPLALNGARLVIDSIDGVRVVQGDFDMDPAAYAERLKEIFHCDLADGMAGCSVGGFRVVSARARVTNGALDMRVRLDLLGLAQGEFALRGNPGGRFNFLLEVQSNPGLGGFMAQSMRLTLNENGVAISARISNLGSQESMRGFVRREGRNLKYRLALQSKTELFGYKQSGVTFVLSNNAGPTRLTADFEFSPASFAPGLSPIQLHMHGELDTEGRITVTGQARMRIFEYDLGRLTLTLSNVPSRRGLTLRGRFDAQAVRVQLAGRVRPGESPVLTGTSDLTIDGHGILGAGFTLSAQGLVAAGRLDLQGMALEMRGTISPRGEVALSASAAVEIPILAGLEVLQQGVECGFKTVESAALCGMARFNDALHCGTQTVTDAVRCGENLVEAGREWITDAVLCGEETITDAAICGSELVAGALSYVTDAAVCGERYVECGTQIIQDAGRCGTEVLQERIPAFSQCAGDMLACVFGNIGGVPCDPVNNPPASCLQFATPRFCTVVAYCPQAESCWTQGPSFQMPRSCNLPLSCWHVTNVVMPATCQFVPECELPATCSVVDYCDRLVVEPNHGLGTYWGTLTVTLGTTLGFSMVGTYCDAGNNCSNWGVEAAVRAGADGAPQVCVGLPEAALPAAAVLGAFTPSGHPEFCAPI